MVVTFSGYRRDANIRLVDGKYEARIFSRLTGLWDWKTFTNYEQASAWARANID